MSNVFVDVPSTCNVVLRFSFKAGVSERFQPKGRTDSCTKLGPRAKT
jgi:hypothetical protein